MLSSTPPRLLGNFGVNPTQPKLAGGWHHNQQLTWKEYQRLHVSPRDQLAVPMPFFACG